MDNPQPHRDAVRRSQARLSLLMLHGARCRTPRIASVGHPCSSASKQCPGAHPVFPAPPACVSATQAQVATVRNATMYLMPFDVETFVARWSHAYHLTSRSNLPSIILSAGLENASTILTKAGRIQLLRQKRPAHVRVQVGCTEIVLRDQAPLHAGNVAFQDGWVFGDLVEALNGLVFFWPGDAVGPIAYGHRHFERYRLEEPAILRVPTRDLLTLNREIDPLFCRYNSGSPRYSRGAASPRGPRTFVTAAQFPQSPCHVVELTFPGPIRLPRSTEMGLSGTGPWNRLFAD